MKNNKKTILIVLCALLAVVVAGTVWVGLRVAPAVNHTMRISELLQPLLNAKNQAMNIAVSAEIGGNQIELESDIFLITEDGVSYLVVEQNGNAVYIADNVLFLANGKAFKIGDTMQLQLSAFEDLLPQIKVLYEALKITAEEADSRTDYSITVTAEQVDALLSALSLKEELPVDGIEELNLCLTERNEKLDQISFSGNAALDSTSVVLNVTLSGFRILASGDYPIPEAVKQSAATVDPNALFSLSEDLYRLVLALAPFADMDSIEGTLGLKVDCGLLQLDSRIELSELKTNPNQQIDPEKLQALPEMLGWLCMEGDIRCTQTGDTYEYTLALDQSAMEELSQMILPEMANYAGDLSEGSVSIILEGDRISSMQVSIKGKINALITQIPVALAAEFLFD